MSSTMARRLVQQCKKADKDSHCCADCGSADASWASITNGVFLCINCAGVHRSLGVRNSVVKSVALDSWTRKEAVLMALGGNSKSKAYFESEGLSKLPISDRYTSEAAREYRERLKEAAAMSLLRISTKCSDACTGIMTPASPSALAAV